MPQCSSRIYVSRRAITSRPSLAIAGTIFDPDQRPVPSLLSLEGRRSRGRGNRRPPLGDLHDRRRRDHATLPPMHPGELLREEFIEPLGSRLARSQKPAGCHAPELSASSPSGSEFLAILPSASDASLERARSSG